MSFSFQLKCLGESIKDKLFKGRLVKVVFDKNITLNIDSRTFEAYDSFANGEDSIEMKNFMSLTQDKKCLMDIGAHYGAFSLVFTAKGVDRLAFAFDPSPKVFGFLLFNAQANSKNNIKVYQNVIGDNNEPVVMRLESVNQLSAIGTQERVRKSKKKFTVESMTIDQFVTMNKIKPDVIKIDTEGFEYQVLKGGFNYLKNNNPLLFLEIHPPKLRNHGLTVRKLWDLLSDLGYNNIIDLQNKEITNPEQYFDYNVPAYRTVVRKIS